MPKHPTSSRVHRDGGGPDDAFVAAVDRVVAWSRSNSRALIIAGVLLLAGVLIGIYYVNSQRRIEAQAQVEYGQVQQSLASGNRQLAIRDLQSFISRFDGTSAARPARLGLADLLLSEGRAEEAVEALGDLPDDLDEPFGIPASRQLAAAYEELGRADDAVSVYRGIGDRARFPFERREALADAARVRFQNGDPAAAADLYERIVDLFEPDEPGRGYYAMWLAEARARAEPGAGTAPIAVDSVPAAAQEDTADAG